MSEFSVIRGFRPQVGKSLTKASELLSHKTGISFSVTMGNGFRQTIARTFSHSKMTPKIMLESHLTNSIQRARQCEGTYLLVPQDTSFYNYAGHHQMAGLGVLQGNIKGIIQHNAMILSESGQPLGVLPQQYWTRQSNRDFQGKESQKWFKVLSQVNESLGDMDKKVVLIADREADILEYFKAERAKSVELLVRICQPRYLEVLSQSQVVRLDAIGDHLSDYGTQQVVIQKNSQQVQLTLSLKAGAVNVLADKDPHSPKSAQTAEGLWVVIAQEIGRTDTQTGKDLYNEKDRAVWYLLSTMPIENQAQVCRIVKFYSLRWRIERFHYTLKSGALQVEKLQFDDVDTLFNALAFYSVVAWQLLAITYLVRQPDEAPAGEVFDPDEVKLLSQISRKPIQTLKEAILALSKIVGFAPSKKQPLPGVKVLAQALERFYYIKVGASASQTKTLQD